MARKSHDRERRDSRVSVPLTPARDALRDTRVARSTIRVAKALDVLSQTLPSVIYQGRKPSAPLSKPADPQPAKTAPKVAKAKPDPVQDRRQLDTHTLLVTSEGWGRKCAYLQTMFGFNAARNGNNNPWLAANVGAANKTG